MEEKVQASTLSGAKSASRGVTDLLETRRTRSPVSSRLACEGPQCGRCWVRFFKAKTGETLGQKGNQQQRQDLLVETCFSQTLRNSSRRPRTTWLPFRSGPPFPAPALQPALDLSCPPQTTSLLCSPPTSWP